jgi:transcriptional regulator with XRE-family HTH domain
VRKWNVAKIDGVSDISRQEQNFAEQVKKRREEMGLSQEQLAARMRTQDLPYVTQATVSRIENLSRPVRLMEAQALTFIFHTTVYSMTNPDQREFFLSLIEMNDRSGRQHYVRFKDELMQTAHAQLVATEDLKELGRLYGNDENLDQALENKIRNIELNRRNFASMPLLKEASEIVSMVKDRGVGKPPPLTS